MGDLVNIRLVALCVLLLGFSFASKAVITVQSVTSTTSTCANNGSITVVANSSPNPGLLYAIVSGPITTPIQNNNTFYSLYPGTYTIRLYDSNFDSLDVQATVTGSYQLPDLSPIGFAPICQGINNGRIVGNADSSKGLLPFTWEILNPLFTGPQATDTFNNLSGGTYQVRMTDACNNFQSRTVVLNSGGTGLGSYGWPRPPQVEFIGCDTVVVTHTITLYKEAAHKALRLRIVNGANTYISNVYAQPVDTINYVPGLYQVRDTLVGISYGSQMQLNITDTCNRSISGSYQTVSPFDFAYNFNGNVTGCTNMISANVRIKSYSNFPYLLTIPKAPVIMTVTDVATNTVVENDTCTQSCSGLFIGPLTSGRVYRVRIVDGCGNVYQQDTIWPQPPTASVIVGSGIGCVDSTAAAFFNFFNFRSSTTITIHSGPTVVGSSKPGYEHSSVISYPKVYTGMRQNGFTLRDLTAGTYAYTVADSCGQSVSDSFTVQPIDLADFKYDYSIKTGCQGETTFYIDAYQQAVAVSLIDSLGNYVYQRSNIQVQRDSVNFLPPGTYTLEIYYGTSPFGGGVFDTSITGSSSCWMIRDTITVYPYSSNTFQTSTTVLCNGITYVELIVDSSKGVPPYMYEILAGPQTYPLQVSNTFQISTLGTYQIRVRDACGNSNVRQITIDGDTFPPIIKKGIMCPNSSVVLAGIPSSYFDYEWELPDGTRFFGDSLVINPLTVADTGLYQLTQYVSINGCTDTFSNTYQVTLTDSFPQTVSLCQGDTLYVGTKPYTVGGNYRDTLPSLMGCDSIIITNLTVLSSSTITNNSTICVGDTLRVGTSIYTQPGSYRDSIGNGQCFDIIITNLAVNNVSRDTINRIICLGDTLRVGSSAYTATGTYQDTLVSSIGCDSILLTNLTVSYSSSSNVYNICQGDSVVANGNVYYNTGTYFDTIPLPNGCDSFVVSTINVQPVPRDTVNAQICAGDTYSFGGNNYTLAGTYYDTIGTANCDSIVMLNLVVGSYLRDTVNGSICPGGSFVFRGSSYTAPGQYHDTVPTSGCDSIITLDLIGLDFLRDTVNQTICPGDSYLFNGVAYTLPGTYFDTVTVGAICDLVSMLNLSVSPYLRDTLSVNICTGGSYNFYGNNLTTSGTYTDTVGGTGCDSIVTLYLTVSPYVRDTVTASICTGRSYNFYGNTLTAAGTYTDTVGGTGCDSIITLQLAIAPYLRDTVNATICTGGSYNFYGNTLTTAGTYTDTVGGTGCDSIIVLNLSVESGPNVAIATNVTEVYQGDTVLLNTTAVIPLDYQWTSAATILNPQSQNPSVIVDQPVWITMTAWNGNCTTVDSIFIDALADTTTDCGAQTYLHIPNAFSPNNDGKNDVFIIFHRGIELGELKIFNRWGELVYRTTDIDQYWDGTYKGNPLPPDVYIYYLTYTPCNGIQQLHKEGSITILK